MKSGRSLACVCVEWVLGLESACCFSQLLPLSLRYSFHRFFRFALFVQSYNRLYITLLSLILVVFCSEDVSTRERKNGILRNISPPSHLFTSLLQLIPPLDHFKLLDPRHSRSLPSRFSLHSQFHPTSRIFFFSRQPLPRLL